MAPLSLSKSPNCPGSLRGPIHLCLPCSSAFVLHWATPLLCCVLIEPSILLRPLYWLFPPSQPFLPLFRTYCEGGLPDCLGQLDCGPPVPFCTSYWLHGKSTDHIDYLRVISKHKDVCYLSPPLGRDLNPAPKQFSKCVSHDGMK